ncbi:hypothetical protein L6164_031951 [Bauhinia variegata]|uniref:Uncharacterized protein n=1 Tax=Bauhinia variegata TaxID=167791 RepID=A0ACB9KM91_BAUVA|nr:hypothetical protein L6164_031951 [Bauhinia variegata]
MHEIKWRHSSFKQFKFMDALVSTHRRSNSDPMKTRVREVELDIYKGSYLPNMEKEMAKLKESNESKKRQFHNIDLQSSLTQEILQLQKRLKQQYVVRCALEKACHLPFSQDAVLESSIPKAAKELIEEIGVLELEVVYLEKYLLSLYRQRFDQQISSISDNDRRLKSVSDVDKGTCAVPTEDNIHISEKETSVPRSGILLSPRNSAGNSINECNNQLEQETVLDSSVHRSHSTLSQRSVCSIETSPMKAKTVESYHSLPLSMLEEAQRANTNSNCLAEHLGTCFSENVQETPNWLSEEMIKCISAIYRELADPPFISHDNTSSPISFSSSVYEASSQVQGNRGRSHCKKLSSFNNPFHNKGAKEFIGPYCSMVKIQQLCRDNEKLKEVEYMLRRFRSLVSRLLEVDPRKMKHEEKLAFWINVHNALVMHALLIYGIPSSNLKRMSSVLKAAYNIGGHTISVGKIQNFILGCRLPRPGQWLRLLSLPTKSKVSDARKAYAINRPEPLVLFALCSGSHSDPAVRLYTPKTVLEELESAKEEYILSTMSITKEQKILLPKMVDFFAKDSGLGSTGLMEMVKPYVPESQRKIIHQFQQKGKSKGIEFIPHNFNFQCLVSKELAW